MLFLLLFAMQNAHAAVDLRLIEGGEHWQVSVAPKGVEVNCGYVYHCTRVDENVCAKTSDRLGWMMVPQGSDEHRLLRKHLGRVGFGYSYVSGPHFLAGRLGQERVVLKLFQSEFSVSQFVLDAGSGSGLVEDGWFIDAASLGTAILQEDSRIGGRVSRGRFNGEMIPRIPPHSVKVSTRKVVESELPAFRVGHLIYDHGLSYDVTPMMDLWRCAALASGSSAPRMEDSDLIVWAGELRTSCAEQIDPILEATCPQVGSSSLDEWIDYADEATLYGEWCGQNWVVDLGETLSVDAREATSDGGHVEFTTLETVVSAYAVLFGESWAEVAIGWVESATQEQVPGLFDAALAADDVDAAFSLFDMYKERMSEQWLVGASDRLIETSANTAGQLIDSGELHAAGRVLSETMRQLDGRLGKAEELRLSQLRERLSRAEQAEQAETRAEQAAYGSRVADPEYREEQYYQCVERVKRGLGCYCEGTWDHRWEVMGCSDAMVHAMIKCEHLSR